MMTFLYVWGVPAVIVFLAYRAVLKDSRASSPIGQNSETAVWLVFAVLVALYFHFSATFKSSQLEAILSTVDSECHSIASKVPTVGDDLVEYVCQEIGDARDINGKRLPPSEQ